MQPVTQPSFLTRREAADFLAENGYPFAATTLAKLFSIGGGPLCAHFGRKPLYAPADLLAWAEGRTSAPRQNSSQPRLPLINKVTENCSAPVDRVEEARP